MKTLGQFYLQHNEYDVQIIVSISEKIKFNAFITNSNGIVGTVHYDDGQISTTGEQVEDIVEQILNQVNQYKLENHGFNQ